MNEFLSRLADLAYEVFGVVMPGVVAALLLVGWCFALGPLVPVFSAGVIQELTLNGILSFVRSLTWDIEIVVAVPLLAAVYFLVTCCCGWPARQGTVS